MAGGGFRSGTELIVDDVYCDEAANHLRLLCEEIEDAFTRYHYILYYIKTESVTLGETHDAVEAFHEMATNLRNKFADIGGCSDITLECFKGEIDSADEYIY